MQSITINADEHTIEQVRQIAENRNKSLEQLVQEWLDDLVAGEKRLAHYNALMEDIWASGDRAERHFTREEMNERR